MPPEVDVRSEKQRTDARCQSWALRQRECKLSYAIIALETRFASDAAQFKSWTPHVLNVLAQTMGLSDAAPKTLPFTLSVKDVLKEK